MVAILLQKINAEELFALRLTCGACAILLIACMHCNVVAASGFLFSGLSVKSRFTVR